MLANANTGSLALGLLRWSARVLSIISTTILLLFLFGEKFDVSKVAAREWLALIFFPVGIIVGFVVGWWKEGLGGAITVASLLLFYLVFMLLLHDNLRRGGWFLVFAFPGLLFLAAYALSRSRRPPALPT
ncbi:MAG: DUF7670 domain-containing protein [Pyrinomonadaceae bacterium]